MDQTIFLFLVQDGIINGAIYALAAIALVLVSAVTRVILVPQGEFIAFGAMTVAALEAGGPPSRLVRTVHLRVGGSEEPTPPHERTPPAPAPPALPPAMAAARQRFTAHYAEVRQFAAAGGRGPVRCLRMGAASS